MANGVSMTKEQKQIKDFMVSAKQSCPTSPCLPPPSIRQFRLNLIGEEFIELANALGFTANFDATNFETEPKWENLVATADAIADLMYVILGTAVACGIDMEPIFQEVHRSNMTKFIDGTFVRTVNTSKAQYVKGPNYSKAKLEPILEQQIAHAT